MDKGAERPLLHGQESYKAKIENNVLSSALDKDKLKNPATKEKQGLLTPLSFSVGVDGAYKVDGWNVCKKDSNARINIPDCKIQKSPEPIKATTVTSTDQKTAPLPITRLEAEKLEDRYRSKGVKSDAQASKGQYFQISHGSGYVAYKATETISDLKNIVVRAAGSACEGDALMRVEYGYNKRKEFTVSNTISHWKEYAMPSLILKKGDVVKVTFLNDRYISGKCDRNLMVDFIELQRHSTAQPASEPSNALSDVQKTVLEAESLKDKYRSTGVKNATSASNGKYYQISHRSGYLAYKAPETFSNLKKIAIRAYGSACEGPAKMRVEYGYSKRKEFTLGDEKAGWKEYTVETPYLRKGETVKVIFLNDRYKPGVCDRNLMVDAITLE